MAEQDANDTGMGAIIRAIIRNPFSAFNLVSIIVGGIGVYYAVDTELKDAKSDIIRVKAEASATRDRVDASYTRGDLRYYELLNRLSKHDTQLAAIETDTRWLVRRLDMSSNTPVPPPPQHP